MPTQYHICILCGIKMECNPYKNYGFCRLAHPSCIRIKNNPMMSRGARHHSNVEKELIITIRRKTYIG